MLQDGIDADWSTLSEFLTAIKLWVPFHLIITHRELCSLPHIKMGCKAQENQNGGGCENSFYDKAKASDLEIWT